MQPEAIVLSDIPLLTEAGLKSMVDLVLLVYLPPEEQIVRADGAQPVTAGKRLQVDLLADADRRETPLCGYRHPQWTARRRRHAGRPRMSGRS